ncbi:hypothetical protein [Paragemmobacter aquarius]|nr:hypothetical protein [Gemmobacter aquarius]
MMQHVVEGPAALSLAMAEGHLQQAMSRSDMVDVLVAASELDRMVRSLGPSARSDQDRAALLRAGDVVGSVLMRLETEMTRGLAARRNDARLRNAYFVPDLT